MPVQRHKHAACPCLFPFGASAQYFSLPLPPGHLVALGESVATLALLSPQAQRHISDLYEDLRDGHNLISLLEVLSGDSLVCAPALFCGPAGITLNAPACLTSLRSLLTAQSVSSSAPSCLLPGSSPPTVPSCPGCWHHS